MVNLQLGGVGVEYEVLNTRWVMTIRPCPNTMVPARRPKSRCPTAWNAPFAITFGCLPPTFRLTITKTSRPACQDPPVGASTAATANAADDEAPRAGTALAVATGPAAMAAARPTVSAAAIVLRICPPQDVLIAESLDEQSNGAAGDQKQQAPVHRPPAHGLQEQLHRIGARTARQRIRSRPPGRHQPGRRQQPRPRN